MIRRRRPRERRRKHQPSRQSALPLPPPAPDALDACTCSLAEACGGCALIGSSYAAQLAYKRQVLEEILASEPILARVPVAPTLPSGEPAAYRHRAKLAVASEDGRVKIGLFQRGSHRIVDIVRCAVHRPLLDEATAVLRRWLAGHRLAVPRGPIKYVDLREAEGRTLYLGLVLECTAEEAGDLPLDDLLDRLPLAGIRLNFNPQRSSYVFGEVNRILHGTGEIEIRVDPAAPPLLVPSGGFLQLNLSVLPALHALMRDHLGDTGPLHDLYCGSGLHGLTLLGEGRELVGIEADAAAVAAARRNATRRGLGPYCRFIAGPVEELYPPLRRVQAARRVVLNPSRPGCRGPVLDALIAEPAHRLAYLSCNPHTLVRDLARLAQGGYGILEVVPVDMMPQTDQVEALALCAHRGK
ncbi:MAG: hypothetical protein Q9Q40_10600 [Acidobacteriota bacterium]|nr:hypothetical protein [Acidobacteriota bacterium]MDQ7087013.1 hypothetical protein [Acidobacteriota bacterium]